MSKSQLPTNTITTELPAQASTRTNGNLDATLPFAGSDAKADLGQFGKYRIVKLLGAGGMGAVYQAEDTVLHRKVAVKILLPELNNQPTARARFLREAQAVAKITHDHIIAVHEVHEHEGLPFLVMPLLEGETLDNRLKRDGRLPVPLAIRIGREVAEALAAAHAAGIIHRDIKPSNIFLESLNRGGGTRVRAKILDFGLARPIEGAEPVTREGAILGTPAYMAPEQGRGEAIDERSDLFSLGCVLYELCTGRKAFNAANYMAILTAIATQTPTPPIKINCEIPVGLDDVIQSLLRKDPGQRPTSADKVADRLRTLEGQFAEASRAATAASRPSKSRFKQRIIVGILIALIASAVPIGLLFGPAWFAMRKRPGPLVDQPPPDQPRPVVAEGLRQPSHPKDLVAVIGDERQRHWGPVTGMALGSQVATCAVGDPFIRLWDPATLDLKEALPIPHPNAFCIARSSSGRWLACGLEPGTIVVWDRSQPTQPPRQVLPPDPAPCTAVDFSADERTLYAGDHEGSLLRMDLTEDELNPVAMAQKKNAGIACLSVSPDGSKLAVGYRTGDLELWDIGKPNPVSLRKWNGHEVDVKALVFARDGSHFWSGGEDGQVLRWTVAGKAKERPRQLPCPGFADGRFPNGIVSLALSANGEHLVVSEGWHFYVWNVSEDPPRVVCRQSHEANGQARAIVSNDGLRIYTSDAFGRVRKRVRKGDAYPFADDVPPQAVHSIAVSNATGDIATVWGDRSLRLWRLDANGPRSLWASKLFTDLPFGLSFNADGSLLVSAEDNTDGPRLWAIEGERVRSLATGETRSNFGIGLSPKGDLVAAARDQPGFVLVGWDGSQLKFLEAKEGNPNAGVCTFSFSSSGKRLATGGDEGHIHVWEVDNANLKQIKYFRTEGTLRSMALHPDGTLVAVANFWAGIQLFDIRDDPPAGVKLTADDGQCVCFDRSGEWIAGGTPDGQITVWETKTRKESRHWKLSGQIVRVAFSPDSKLLYSLNGNGTIYALRVK